MRIKLFLMNKMQFVYLLFIASLVICSCSDPAKTEIDLLLGMKYRYSFTKSGERTEEHIIEITKSKNDTNQFCFSGNSQIGRSPISLIFAKHPPLFRKQEYKDEEIFEIRSVPEPDTLTCVIIPQ